MDAKKYNNTKLALGIFRAVLTFLLLLVFVASGLSSALYDFAVHYAGDGYSGFLFFVLSAGFIFSVIFFPLKYYSGYVLEHKYNLSNQTFVKWIGEELKGTVVSLAIGIPVLLFFYYVLQSFGEMWWLPFAIMLFILSVVLARIVPVFIIPLFYKLTPIDDSGLKNRITSLAKDAGIKVENVFRFDMSKNTKKANAAFTGIGKSKRILLGDTLLDQYSDDQIETVIAHELGHYKKKHIIKNIVTGTIFSFLTLFLISVLYEFSLPWFGFNSIMEAPALPLLAVWSMLTGLALTPIGNILSRKYEYEADEYAVVSTGKKEAFISTLEKLTDQNLGDKKPHPFVEWYFYSHPSVKKRINALESLKAGQEIEDVKQDYSQTIEETS